MVNASKTLWKVVLTVVFTAVMGCSTTSTKTTVKRAPWISFKGAKTVSIESQVKCVDAWAGPETVTHTTERSREGALGKVSLTTSVNTGELAVRQESCDSDPFFSQVQAQLMSDASTHLQRLGYSIVPRGQGQHSLVITGTVTRYRELSRRGERKDTEQDKTCAKTCGAPTCQTYQLAGRVLLNVVYVGPELPAVPQQKVERQNNFIGLANPDPNESINVMTMDVGKRSYAVCNEGQARGLLTESAFVWPRGAQEMAKWLRDSYVRMFSAYTEEFKCPLFKIKGSDENAAGLEAAKSGNWNGALEQFSKAMGKLTDKEQKAQAAYNAGVAAMNLSQLDKAKDLLHVSSDLFPTDESSKMLEEVYRRYVDSHKM